MGPIKEKYFGVLERINGGRKWGRVKVACQEGLFKEVNFKLRTEMCQPEWIGKVTSEKALPDRPVCWGSRGKAFGSSLAGMA